MSGKSLESKIQEVSRNITCPYCQTICMALLGLSNAIGGFPPIGQSKTETNPLISRTKIGRRNTVVPTLYIRGQDDSISIREQFDVIESGGTTHVVVNVKRENVFYVVLMCQALNPNFINLVINQWNQTKT